MQPPSDKQYVRAKLASGLWLTGRYLRRNPLLNGQPGYTVKVGLNSTGAYYEETIVEWEPIQDNQLPLFKAT